jgi:WD40 repeat protein
VATAGLDDHRVRIWKDEQTEPLFDLTHDGYVTRLLFTGDGQHLVAGTGVSALNQANVTQSTLQPMNALRLWDVNTGTPVGHALQQNAPVADLASSPDQKTLLSADGAVVRFWDLRALVGAGPTLSQPDAVSALAFSPEGKRLLSGGFDKTLRLWDLASRKLLASALVPQSNIIRYLMFSPDGKQLLAGSDNNSVTLYDAETLKPITPALKHDNSTYIAGSAFRPDGQGVLTITVGGEVWMWDGKETATGKKRLGEFLALSPDGKVAATKGKEAVELSDPATGAAIASIPLKYLFISGAAFSPDGKWLVICSDNQLVTWDMVNHRKIREPVLIILTTYLQHIRSLRIDPDNETVWVRGDHAARKYSLRSGKALGLPILHDPEMMSLASSMDGRTMASGGRDGKILLWNPLPNIPYGYESIERWLEMTTGMALNKEGVVGLLKPREWEERRKELEKLEKDSTTELARSLE